MNKYSSYQDTDCDWIGKIPSSWRLVRGRFLFRSQKEINRDMQCENLLSLTYDGVLNKDFSGSEGLRPENYNTYQIFQKDNLVFKMIDLENVKTSRVGIVHEKGIMSSAYIRFEVIKTKIEPKFAYWFYYDLYKKEIYNSIGSGVRSTLSSSDLLEMELPVPQLKEQKLISRYLDHKTKQIDLLIEKIQKKIELLREQLTSFINKCVTKGLDPSVEKKDSGVEWIGEIPSHWDILPLKYFGKVTLGKMLTSEDQGGYSLKPYLRSTNIQKERVDVSDVNEMWFSVSELENLRLLKGDLLFNEGGDVGRTCIWLNELDECYIQNSVNRVRFEKDNEWFFLYLSFLYHSVGHYDSIVNRVSIPHLTKEKLESVIFLKPPINEQQQIFEYIDEQIQKTDKRILNEEKRIELLKEYRQSLISEVVTGKKRVV